MDEPLASADPIPSALVSQGGVPIRVQGAGCALCGRPTYDPDKRERPWARGVSSGRQVLICPECQDTRPGWDSSLDRCESCGSPRLSLTLDEVTCRACGRIKGTVDITDPVVEHLLEP